MAESLESLVEKLRINLTETMRKLEEENHEKKVTLEAKHQQEIELLGDKEKVEKGELDAKQSQRRKDLLVKQHQEKEKLINNYEKKLKAMKENKTCPNTSNREVPECPVCLEPMNPPLRIFQCSQGHYLCENCNNNKEIKSCPTCRRQIVGRNIGMEQAIELMSASPDRPSWHQSEVAQNQRKTSVERPDGNIWMCSLCTFHNRENKSICEMCDKAMDEPNVTESQNEVHSDDGGLSCDKCTLINDEGAEICAACGATLGMVYSDLSITDSSDSDPGFVYSPILRPRRKVTRGSRRGNSRLDFPPLMRLAEGRRDQSPVDSERLQSAAYVSSVNSGRCLSSTYVRRGLSPRGQSPARVNLTREADNAASRPAIHVPGGKDIVKERNAFSEPGNPDTVEDSVSDNEYDEELNTQNINPSGDDESDEDFFECDEDLIHGAVENKDEELNPFS